MYKITGHKSHFQAVSVQKHLRLRYEEAGWSMALIEDIQVIYKGSA